jgi:two-component system sensor kinase FixL
MSGERFRWPAGDEVKDHVRDICLVIDAADGSLLDCNTAAVIGYGYPRAELLTRTVFDLRADPPTSVTAQMRRADGEGLLFETLHRRADGSTFPVEVSSHGETIDGRRVLISVIRDITERRRHEAERERLLVATQQALASRDEFLLIASHELRTPISVMGLQLHQIRRLIARGEPIDRLIAAAEAASSQVDRLDELVKVLLDVTRIASGQLELERTWVELPELVDDVVGRMRDHAARTGAVIATDVPAVGGQWDRLRLDQALTNLVANAIKYGEGRPIDVSSRAAGDAIRIEVRDHGIGFAPEDRARIFDKFVRAVPLANYGGLGLGLFITRQIVEAHGGSIDADGMPGEGATFRITLPRAAP